MSSSKVENLNIQIYDEKSEENSSEDSATQIMAAEKTMIREEQMIP